MTSFPPISPDLVPALAEALDAGHGAVVVLIEATDGVATRLAWRTSPVSTLTLHEIALFVLEQTIERAKALSDGSGRPALPHLDDAKRSLQAAFATIDGTPVPTIGRA